MLNSYIHTIILTSNYLSKKKKDGIWKQSGVPLVPLLLFLSHWWWRQKQFYTETLPQTHIQGFPVVFICQFTQNPALPVLSHYSDIFYMANWCCRFNICVTSVRCDMTMTGQLTHPFTGTTAHLWCGFWYCLWGGLQRSIETNPPFHLSNLYTDDELEKRHKKTILKSHHKHALVLIQELL